MFAPFFEVTVPMHFLSRVPQTLSLLFHSLLFQSGRLLASGKFAWDCTVPICLQWMRSIFHFLYIITARYYVCTLQTVLQRELASPQSWCAWLRQLKWAPLSQTPAEVRKHTFIALCKISNSKFSLVGWKCWYCSPASQLQTPYCFLTAFLSVLLTEWFQQFLAAQGVWSGSGFWGTATHFWYAYKAHGQWD